MKHEKAFSTGGFYTFVLEANLMLHKQVAEAGARILSALIADTTLTKLRILDLACGGAPVSIAAMMAANPETLFDYTGIDINPDQVNLLKESFRFSPNVGVRTVLEGNAWDFENTLAGEQFDVVFSGMNLHHGTEEEIRCLLLQTRSVLSAAGIFLNHDFYRANGLPCLRRPDYNPANPAESFLLIEKTVLERYRCSGPGDQSGSTGHECSHGQPDWRLPFVEIYSRALLSKGADPEGVDQIMSHVLCRDFPLSLAEMQSVMKDTGYTFEQVPLKSENEPMHGHFCLIAGRPV